MKKGVCQAATFLALLVNELSHAPEPLQFLVVGLG
jgi:hypothetical protein